MQLVAKLHQELVRLPAVVFSTANPGNTTTGVPGAVVADPHKAVLDVLDPALKALTDLGTHQLLRPAAQAMARCLEGRLAMVHDDHFGDAASSMRAHGGGGGDEEVDASFHLVEFDRALTALLREHLSRLPKDSSFVGKSVKGLAARLVRSYVSHLSLVRPLSEAGRLKMAKDMTQFEMTLTKLAKPSELGRSYLELRDFRELIFLRDDATTPAAAGSPDEGPSAAALLAHHKNRNTLRPSTVINHCFTRAPHTLDSPPNHMRVRPQQ